MTEATRARRAGGPADRHQARSDAPLWEIWLIEGMADGRQALLAKIHHSIIDGQSGAELATLLYDLEADPPPDPHPPPDQPEPAPDQIERLGHSAWHAASWPVRAGKFSRQLLRQGRTVARFGRTEQAPAHPFQTPRAVFNGRLTSRREFCAAQVSLEKAKAVKDAAGVKLNDVVLAIAAGAARRYLEVEAELPDKPLIAQVPVSLRTGDQEQSIGTQVATLFCSLATDVDDVAERLAVIHAGSRAGKEARRELSAAHEVNWTDTLPPALIAVAAR
ncbi:MAG: wax ester/triacylglycerol synthase family O-acyltransferase, partial [Acidimicrobiales bacterium]